MLTDIDATLHVLLTPDGSLASANIIPAAVLILYLAIRPHSTVVV